MLKIPVYILIASLLLSLSACKPAEKQTDNNNKTSSMVETTAAVSDTDEYGRPLVKSSIPDDLSFNGEQVTVLLREKTSIFDSKGEFVAESENGEVVNDAVYKRNLEVQEQLNVKLNYVVCPGADYNQYATTLRKSILSGEGAYDILAMYAYYGVALASENMMYNLRDIPYVDMDKPWWNKSFTDEMTLYNQQYYAVGDLSLTSTQCTHAIFFNKRLVRDYLGDIDLYDTVNKGKWTIDFLSSLVKDMYIDVNGDSIRDSKDKYGVGLHAVSIPVDAYLDAFDLKITQKDSEGIPRLVYNNERTISAFDKIYNLMFNNNGVGYDPATIETYYMVQDKFNNCENVFLIDIFCATDKLRNMQDDYGVLPMFKYDEKQNGYYTNVADIYSLLGVSSDTKSPEVTGAVFELMAQKSYEHVTPAYFEIALKRKYASEDKDARMYDLIRAGTRYNFGFVYSNNINNPIWIWRSLINTKKKDFVSTFEKSEASIQKLLDKVIEFYAQNK